MDTKHDNQDRPETARREPGVMRFIRRNIVAIIIVLGLIAGYFFFRTAPSDVASVAELEAMMTSGRPVLLEFYSNT